MELIKPQSAYFEDYNRAVQESFDHHVTEWQPYQPEQYALWRAHILDTLAAYETGTDLPEGMPITYTYWCVEDGAFIGEI